MDCGNPTRIYNTIDFSTPKNDAHQSLFAVAFLLFLCSLLFVPVSADAATLSKPPNNLGLVGYWSFNEDSGNVATDFSGNGNHGSLENGPQWVNGKLGKALEFDGSGDHITLTSSSIIPTSGDFTIAFWVNADNTPNGDDRVVIGTGTAAGQRNYIYTTTTFGAASNQLRVWFGDSEILVGNDIRGAGWKHVVITRSGNSWVLYEDGEVVDTETSAVTLASYSEFRIGGGTDADAHWHSGGIDEVRIYSRALTATEVAGLNKSGVARIVSSSQLTAGTSLEEGLVGHWTFDGRDMVPNVRNASGNGNHGNLVDFTSTTTAIGKLGQGLNFDSSRQYVAVPNDSLRPPADLTVSFWIRPFVDWNDEPNGVWRLIENQSGPSGWVIYVNGFSQESLFLGVCGGEGVECVFRNSSALEWNANQWYNISVVYFADSEDVAFYRDGDLISINTNGFGHSIVYPDTPLRVGGSLVDDSLHGTMDDVRIYDRALSANEVKRLANLGQATANAPSQTLTQGTSLASGLVGHWTFDGPDLVDNVADVSGNGNHGNLINFPATSSAVAIGKLGQALAFNARHIRIGTANWSGTTGTFSFWAYPTTNPTGTNNYVLCHNTLGAGGSCGSGNRIYGRLSDGTLRLGLGSTGNINTGLTFSINQWVHFTVTYNSGSWVAYKNGGQAVASGSYSGTPTIQTSAFIGADPTTGGSTHFTGIIDDIRVYSRVLSANQIKQLYRMGQ